MQCYSAFSADLAGAVVAGLPAIGRDSVRRPYFLILPPAPPQKLGTPQKDVIIKSDAPDTLLLEKHADYIASYGSKKDDYEYCMSEYLRMSGIYWGLTVMDLMGQLHRRNREEILTRLY